MRKIIIQKIPGICVTLSSEHFNNLNNFENDDLYVYNEKLFFEKYFNDNIRFDFSKYCEFINEKYIDKEILIIPISTNEIQNIINEDIDLLMNKIDIYLKKVNFDRLFFRFDSCSTKDSKIKNEIKTSKDIIERILTSKRCLHMLNTYKKYNCSTNLIIRKFDENICLKNEFRIFIKNKQIKCVSQYNCYKNYNITTSMIFDLDLELQSNDFSKQIKDLPFDDCILDIHYNHNNNELQIIECNPFGSKSPTGSGLFNWIIDNEIIMNDHNIIYYRVLSE